MDGNAERYYKSARALFLPVHSVVEISGFELKFGSRYYLFRECETPFNNISSARIAADKFCTSQLLAKKGIPVPESVVLCLEEFRQNKTAEITAHLKLPLVIKPLLGSQGKDVLCNIQSREELLSHLDYYFNHYEQVIIEEFHGRLNSYRVLVFKGQIMGVVQRFPATVFGDGIHSIEQLVEIENKERQVISDFLGPIRIDEECSIKLKELNINKEYIPSAREKIVLAYTSNSTRGGTYKSLGNQICQENRKLMIKVASVLNLGLAGIDLECTDINIPISQSNGVVIEVNHRPSVRIHELPLTGKPHLVTRKIMRSFIYKHPLVYLFSLYKNKSLSVFLRTTAVLLICGLIYWWFI